MSQYSDLTANWNYPTAMRCGVGRIKELADICKELGMKRPLLVTDPGLAKLSMIGDILDDCKRKGMPLGLFQDVKPNPTGKNVEDGLQVYRDNGYDGIIAFGGGSALDAAKAIALVSGQDLPLWDFEDEGDNWTRVNPDGVAPIIAVPTTAGTGSEVGRASVIVHEETQSKKIIFHPKMLPSVVIADPELTAGLPPHITAATGMDALSHCLEALCAPGYHPMADGIAVEGIRIIAKWLPVAVEEGTNLTARNHMLVAASMGATAFQKGLGVMHSLAHPIGALYDTHHGLANAVLMPYALEYNKSAIEERMSRLAAYLGLTHSSFDAVLEWVLGLRSRFGIPNGLSGLEIDASRVDEIARKAAIDPTAPTNAIPLTAKDMKAIFMNALNES